MTKTHNFILIAILSLFLISCSQHDINKGIALQTIETYLQEKPIYESTAFTIGKTKLKVSKNKRLLTVYNTLEQQGYLNFQGQDTKKKWLAKDSTWSATISITPKSTPYIVQNRNNRVVVKTQLLVLQQKNTLQILEKGKRTAKVRVFLDKEPTPFYDLKPSKNTNSDFITKDFKLRYTKDNTWIVTE
ncbi:hypothetical protein [Myroides sp. LJL119]